MRFDLIGRRDAINDLMIILASDPKDFPARHDLGLCYRNMGWMTVLRNPTRRDAGDQSNIFMKSDA
jgi:hypothetical protein